jgi:hypothetical protein
MFILMAAVLGAAQAEGPAAASIVPTKDCSAQRLEIIVTGTSKGKPRQSTVRLCATPGRSEAEWIDTLKDSVAKVTADPKMPPSVKQQIITAVNAEIVRLGAAPAPTVAIAAPKLINAPALPPPRRAPVAPAPQYSALPPFPAPVVAKPAIGTAAGAAAATAYVAPLPRPRMSFTCFSAGDIAGDGPCFAFDRHTRITVRAGEPLKDTVLRFVLSGEERADYTLPPLGRGRSASFNLPPAVCSRIAGGNLSIRIVRGPAGKPNLAQVVGTEGPFNLTC